MLQRSCMLLIASSVQFSCSVMSDPLRPHELQHARPPCPSLNSQSSLKLTSIKSVIPSSHFILCHPLLLLPLIPPSIRVFSNESHLLMWWPKYWSFSFSIIPSKKHPGLISFRIDWLYMAFIMLTYICSTPIFWEFCIMKGCWMLSYAFPPSVEMIIQSFILFMWCVSLSGLCMLSHTYKLGINPIWSRHVVLIMCYWIWLACVSLRIFESMLIRDIAV